MILKKVHTILALNGDIIDKENEAQYGKDITKEIKR